MIFAKKSLGQNFLISPRIVDMIAAAGNLAPGMTVLEIGPGKGALTKALLATGANVVAVEKDDRLIPVLTEMFKKEAEEGRFELLHADVMESIETVRARVTEIAAERGYQVIANIPYYITGALIRGFLSNAPRPTTMILMVQKEVADRVIARDGRESILSLAVKAYADPSLVVNVSRGNFFPAPNVDSAVIKLSNVRNPFADKAAEDRFFEVVKAGFAQKRKKLSSNLKNALPKEEIFLKFAQNSLDENVRAEDVSLEKWLKISSI